MPVRAVSRVGFQPLDYPNATEILRSMPRVSFYRGLSPARSDSSVPFPWIGPDTLHYGPGEAGGSPDVASPRSSGDRAPPSGGGSAGSNPVGGADISPCQRLFCTASQSNHLPRGAQRVHISKCRRPSRVHCIGHDVEPITEDMAVGFGQSYVPWRGLLCPICSATNAARLS